MPVWLLQQPKENNLTDKGKLAEKRGRKAKGSKAHQEP